MEEDRLAAKADVQELKTSLNKWLSGILLLQAFSMTIMAVVAMDQLLK
jgi:hypothetical protein